MYPYGRPQHDFEATITAFPTAAGGRRNAMFSGYRPNHDLGLGGLNDATHVYPEGGTLEPGASGHALLWLFAPELQVGRLYVGMEFTVQEGPHVVGRGIIRRVVAPHLAKPANPALQPTPQSRRG